jgi:uncharacterized protein YraI
MLNLKSKNLNLTIILVVVIAILLGACAPAATPAPTQDTASIQTQAAQTVVADLTVNAPAPTQIPPTAMPPTEAPTQAPPGPTPDPNLPVAIVPTPVPGEPSAVANFNTTIYGGPGDSYVVYASFLGGATAKVTGVSEDGLWWVISVPPAPNGQGWVSGEWVAVTGAEGVPVVPTPPVPPTAEMVPPGPDDPQVTAIANVYVRTGPATNFPAYGIAFNGASGRVIGKSEDGQWWVVRIDPAIVGAGYGWVDAQYTQAQNVEDVQTIASPQVPETVAPTSPPEGVPAATAIEFVNVRTGPGTNYPVLGVASPGAAAAVSGKSSDSAWWQVVIPAAYAVEGFGWVSADYVITKNTENVPVVEAPPAPPVVETTPPAPSGTVGCQVVAQEPVDGTVYAPGSSFSTTWVLLNTSSETWNSGETDMAFSGAAANLTLHQGSDRYDLLTNVEPGWTYNFSVPMIAPFDPGTYGELWQVIVGSQPVCNFYVYINVQ